MRRAIRWLFEEAEQGSGRTQVRIVIGASTVWLILSVAILAILLSGCAPGQP